MHEVVVDLDEYEVNPKDSSMVPMLHVVSRCRDCDMYANSLQMCGYGGELVHRSPNSFCRDWERR